MILYGKMAVDSERFFGEIAVMDKVDKSGMARSLADKVRTTLRSITLAIYL